MFTNCHEIQWVPRPPLPRPMWLRNVRKLKLYSKRWKQLVAWRKWQRLFELLPGALRLDFNVRLAGAAPQVFQQGHHWRDRNLHLKLHPSHRKQDTHLERFHPQQEHRLLCILRHVRGVDTFWKINSEGINMEIKRWT